MLFNRKPSSPGRLTENTSSETLPSFTCVRGDSFSTSHKLYRFNSFLLPYISLRSIPKGLTNKVMEFGLDSKSNGETSKHFNREVDVRFSFSDKPLK